MNAVGRVKHYSASVDELDERYVPTFRGVLLLETGLDLDPETIKLAVAVADEAARVTLYSFSGLAFRESSHWCDLRSCGGDERQMLEQAVAYLEKRGAIIRLATDPNIVRLK